MALNPTHNGSQSRTAGEFRASALTRREVFVWLACILFVNQILSLQVEVQGQILVFPHALLAKSVYFYLGWYAVINLLLASNSGQPASPLDLTVAFAGALINLLPILSSSWLSTTAVGLLLLVIRRDTDSKLRAAAAVMLALAFNGYWGPKLFGIFGYYILRADAALVGSALSLTQPGMGWHETVVGRVGGHSVLVFSPCSSFHNISLGLLCWISITKLVRTSWVRADIVVALAVCATVILFNATRLYLMALSNDHYAYWHGGTGELLMAWALTFTVLLISLYGALRLDTCK